MEGNQSKTMANDMAAIMNRKAPAMSSISLISILLSAATAAVLYILYFIVFVIKQTSLCSLVEASRRINCQPVPACFLRCALAEDEMIPWRAKFCKPLLSDFVKLRQRAGGWIALTLTKTVQNIWIEEDFFDELKGKFGILEFLHANLITAALKKVFCEY